MRKPITRAGSYTDPKNPNSDGDEYLDGYEILMGWDPNDPNGDADGDGLSDSDEVDIGTDPNVWDTDDDDLPDGWEYYYYNYVISAYSYNGFLDPLNDDSNGDGILDCDEIADIKYNAEGGEGTYETYYFVNDYLSNYQEWFWDLSPFKEDYDEDGYYDGVEIIEVDELERHSFEDDEITNGVYVASHPRIWESQPGDVDGDTHDDIDNDEDDKTNEPGWDEDDVNPHDTEGIDIFDADNDNDGWRDVDEMSAGEGSEFNPGVDGDPCDDDTDDDGVLDGVEVHTDGTDPLDPWDNLLDSDGDTINDYAELNTFFEKSEIDWDGDHAIDYCTDPNNADTDDDGSNDNIELIFKEYTDTCHPLKMEATLVIYDTSVHTNEHVTDVIYPYKGWSVSGQYEIKKTNANEPPWASLAKELAPYLIFEDLNKEYPTSIFFDDDRDMSDNGKPGYYPDGSLNKGAPDVPSRDGINTGYYTKTLQQKKDVTAVYMNVLKDGNLLGIQYWFYYPTHDCPMGDMHTHDWWYYWIVYNMNQHKPTKTYFDFHHNVREKSWSDIYKIGFHPKVWVDAGGHRYMWSGYYSTYSISWSLDSSIIEGLEDIVESVVSGFNLVDIDVKLKLTFSQSEDILFDLMLCALSAMDVMPFGLDFIIKWEVEILSIKYSGSYSISIDEALGYVFGTLGDLAEFLIEKLVKAREGVDEYNMPYLNVIGQWRVDDHNFDEGETLPVKDFNHWIYIYETTDEEKYDPDLDLIINQQVVRVGFSGDNIYDEFFANEWPSGIRKNDYLFTLDSSYKEYLGEGTVEEELIIAFINEGVSLSEDAIISEIKQNYWEIKDEDNIYLIEDIDVELKIYKSFWRKTYLLWMEKKYAGAVAAGEDANMYEAWTWTEYAYKEQGKKAWRHTEFEPLEQLLEMFKEFLP